MKSCHPVLNYQKDVGNIGIGHPESLCKYFDKYPTL